MYHTPVLLQESIAGLAIKPDGIYVDVTFGGGGHSKEILKHLNTGRLLAFDQDEDAIKNKIDHHGFELVHSNFIFMRNYLKLHKALPVNGILADLGVSSHQFDVPERGFSTRFNSILDMRMNQNSSLTGSKIINTYSKEDLIQIFRNYGEINNAPTLAEAIIRNREESKIEKVAELKEAIQHCYKNNLENKYLARVFQAIRIEVNQELNALKLFLKQSVKSMVSGSRLVIITYHSLEDRLVKNFFRSGNFEGEIQKDFYGNQLVELKIINKKPIVPSKDEVSKNSRSRSAKLRIAEKI